MARANDKRKLFVDDHDRIMFLELMKIVRELYHIEWQMFVLMNTHFHAKVRTPLGNVSAAMQQLISRFAQWWNQRRGRRGHLLEGRFKSPLIEDGRYALEVVRYIALNPVKANYVDRAADWPWSSHAALAGQQTPPEFLDIDWLRDCFEGPTIRDCRRQYRRYIDKTEHDPIEFLDAVATGSPDFEAEVRGLIGRRFHGIIVPRSYRALARPTLGALFAGINGDRAGRNHMVLRAQVAYGYTQAQIARSLSLHPNTISKITRTVRRQRYCRV